MRITKEHLEHLVVTLNRYTDNPEHPYTRDARGFRHNPGCYYLDWDGLGVRLVQMADGGGERTPLGDSLNTKRKLFERIQAMIEGVRVGRALGGRAAR